MGIQEGALAVVMLLVCWAIVDGALRIGHWVLDWCDRREDAKFRAERLLAEAQVNLLSPAQDAHCGYCGISTDPEQICQRCWNELAESELLNERVSWEYMTRD